MNQSRDWVGCLTKFEYDVKQDRGECVAYIDDTCDGYALVFYDRGVATAICEGGIVAEEYVWEPDLAIHRFYKGDKVTITF